MKGKTQFTKQEADIIITQIRKKISASTSEQKLIRNKIRSLGFYASDFGIGGGYTEHDFLNVITIIQGDSIISSISKIKSPSQLSEALGRKSKKRKYSDEAYILDLCDTILGMIGKRQHRFDFLRGDSGTPLPVDIYYPDLKLVIEYRELQHSEEVKFFNKKQTVSGVDRGEQRKIYDQRRRDVLPKNNIELVEFGYNEFEHTRSKKLIRNEVKDNLVIKIKLKKFIDK